MNQSSTRPTAARTSAPRDRSRGATLIEALVALCFAAVFAALVYSFSRSCLQSTAAQQTLGDAQESAHLALELLTRDLRQSGFNGAGKPMLGIIHADDAYVAVQSDWNGDGDCSDSNESIGYGADATGVTLTRTFGSASPQPLIDHLVPGSLQLQYFDAAGTLLTPGTSGLDPAQLRAIRRIEVAFTVAAPSRSSSIRVPTECAVASTVILRNVPAE